MVVVVDDDVVVVDVLVVNKDFFYWLVVTAEKPERLDEVKNEDGQKPLNLLILFVEDVWW